MAAATYSMTSGDSDVSGEKTPIKTGCVIECTGESGGWAGAVGKANRLLEQPDDFGEQNI